MPLRRMLRAVSERLSAQAEGVDALATGRAEKMNESRMFSKIVVMDLLAGVAGARSAARFGTAIKEEL
jgi:hypothetical protein